MGVEPNVPKSATGLGPGPSRQPGPVGDGRWRRASEGGVDVALVLALHWEQGRESGRSGVPVA